MRPLLFTVVLLVAVTIPVLADPSASPESAAPKVPSLLPDGAGGMLLQLGMALILVVGLILGLHAVARRWGRSFSNGGSTERIEIVSQRPMGARLSLAVVQVMGQALLVGISPQGIRKISDLGPVEQEKEAPAGFHLGPDPRASRRSPLAPRMEGGGFAAPVARWLARWRSRSRLLRKASDAASPSFDDGSVGSAAGAASPRAVPSSSGPGAAPSTPGADFEGQFRHRFEALRERYASLEELASRMGTRS